METNKSYGINNKRPIENHETAAWADIEKVDDISRVPIPTKEGVQNAKEWVESNEK